jgi:VanZ family protein
MSATSIIIRPVLEFLFPAASEESLQLMHFYIRKCAHFTEYAILALWAIRAFRHSAAVYLSRFPYHFSFLVVVIVALLDELNQRFISSRTGSIWDVMLDASGGLFAIVAVYLISRRRKSGQPNSGPTC